MSKIPKYVKIRDKFYASDDKDILSIYKEDIAEMFSFVDWKDVVEVNYQIYDRLSLAARCYLCWLIKRDTGLSYSAIARLVSKTCAYARLAVLAWPLYRTAIEDGDELDALHIVGARALKRAARENAQALSRLVDT